MSSDCTVPQQIRQKFFEVTNNKLEKFYENDINRIRTSDSWLLRCYEHNANNIDKAVKMLVEMCEWRKSFGVYNLNETTLSKELLDLGQIFSRNRDIDGSALIIFRSYLHKSSNTEGLKKILVYWLEKIDREDNGKAISLFFDQQNSGLANFDLDFLMQFIFPLFDLYYPCFLNNIYIYELPWILSGPLKIVKNLLPERFKKALITISKSNINEYISKENCLKSWNNGLDNYKYEFVFDKSPIDNNDNETIERKVRFNGSEQLQNGDNISEVSDSENPLIITPKYILKFENGNDCCMGQVTLFNTIDKPIAYKFKTTAPEKFRLNMGCGILNPGLNKNIAITLSNGYYLHHDKFQILSMVLEANNTDDVNHLWKNSKDKTVFEHRIMCEQMDNIYKSETYSVTSNHVTESDEIFRKNILKNLNDLSTKCDEFQRYMSQQVTRLEYFIILMIAILISCLIFGQRPIF